MGLMDWFAGATPGAMVGDAAQKVIGGLFDGLDKLIDNFHLSEEDRIKLKIEIANQKLETFKAQISDIQSARQMQMATHSVWPGTLSLVMLIGFFGGGGYVLVYGIPGDATAEAKQIVNMFSVALISGLSSVLGYWLGSSAGSDQKNAMLYHSTPTPPKTPDRPTH